MACHPDYFPSIPSSPRPSPAVLEIGSGRNPILQDGWVHLDIRDVYHVEYVQSATDLSNFDDDEFERIVARDVIEHIGWREIPRTLCEWLRVAPVVEIETPDAWELAQILYFPTSDRRVANETDFEMFNRTAFGHQDYPENSHFSYFTPAWLTRLLMEAGACCVRTKHSDGCRFVLEAFSGRGSDHAALEEACDGACCRGHGGMGDG